ncbi:Tetracyclin repressor domain-containing protein [Pseudoxanthomonas suwonensis 11-1]|uniref:Tetracyclin repressor domain-containing protein n=1 Tax=Pseudoxanthomonas suwonensis (strain 11-1) TaxID=743721 RepID=E6WR59_PSEUU|nr:TetR/AcrR family transcriptional regulator C-terminal domain-containing protein [Pseudoxanthomonas suwonensis]ADV26804.1 Tetracyclin repressor domain-containing protein [Pseudoxanthomonas suwonensis 11-1]
MAIQREQIIETAFRLLDEEGLDGMTLRKLASGLGVRAPSLYWHFSGKRALLDAMADALLADVARNIPPASPWRQTLHRIGRELRQAFKSRRDGARVYAGTYAVSPNVLRTAEAMTSAFARAGADPALAASASLHVMYYVLGFVIEEQALPADPAELDALGNAFLAAVRAGHPALWQARDTLLERDFDDRFAQGLELLLDGIGQRLAREAERAP